ncbi:Gp37-like protein [Nocardia acidivorans]|uniref:Gp37-like protein n=1 Tax=Nocardia acidivorans TaxID=404580 RepID=UPI00082D662C|nr:phage tail protein [Nocardia acidivorans]
MSWDHAAAARRLDVLEREDQQFRADQTVLVRYYDKWKSEVGEEHNYTSLQFSRVRNAAGGLKMSVPRKDFLYYDHFFANEDGEDATIPITVNTKAFRWDGYVTRAAIIRDENGIETIDIEAIHAWQHIASICCWASPFAPIIAQWPRHHLVIAPVITMALTYLSANLIRLQSQYGSLDPSGAMWPITIVPVDVWHDVSKAGAALARFDMADALLVSQLDDAGCLLDVRFFLPEEDEQPAPDHYTLDRPTVVIEGKNKSNITGPTGTLLDGFLLFVEDFLDDGTTPVRYPAFDAQSEYEAVYANPGPLGTQRGLPWVWYREGEYSGLGPSEVAVHKPTAIDVIVGGKSPGWVNAGIEIAIKNLLSWLGLLIGVPGLDSLYTGQLDDVFLAFMVYTDQGRARRAGPYAFRELYITGSDKAFTLDGVMSGKRGLRQTRGYTSQKVSIGDGSPYTFGKDFEVGDQIGFQVADQLFVDYVTEATFTDDRGAAARWELVIGDGSDEEDPVVKAWGRLGTLAQIVKTLSTDVGADLDLIIF